LEYILPRALPWAGMLRPFRAKKCNKKISLKKYNFFVLHPFHNCSFTFLNHDYTEEDEKDEFKVFLFILFILFIFFSVIMVQKLNEQFGMHMLDV